MLYFVHDAFHQCRFTFTVFADKCHLITAFYCQSGVAEDNFITIALAYTIHNDGIVARTG